MSFRIARRTLRARLLLLPLAVLLVLAVAGSAGAATITVNSNGDDAADDGECTLREAITSANTNTASGTMTDECAAGSGPDSIGFDISGPGPHAIQPTSDLPEITTTMTIDGETDPQQIGLDGMSSGDFGLRISGDGVVINDLTFVRWLYGMQIYDGADSVAVRNCRIGTNLVGDPGLGNSIAGIEVSGGVSNTEISDSVISSSGQQGVRIQDGDTTGTTLRGNLIGTDPSGISSLPNSIGGIRIHDATDTRIGGPDPSDSNVISGNVVRAS